MDDVHKLEELFRSGFILADEYHSRLSTLNLDTVSFNSALSLYQLQALTGKIKGPKNTEDLQNNLRSLRIITSDPDASQQIDEILDENILPTLGTYLVDINIPSDIAHEILWILTNILGGNGEQLKRVIEIGLVPVIVKYLQANDPRLSEQAVLAIGNIAGESAEHRDIVISNNVIPVLKGMVGNSSTKLHLIKTISWALSNICRGKPISSFIVDELVPVFAHLILKFEDDEVITDSLWGLSFLTEKISEYPSIADYLLNSGVVDKILTLCSENGTVLPALKIMGNIVTGSDLHVDVVLKKKLLFILHLLLSSPKPRTIVKETCWTISNITAGTCNHIQAVIDSGVMAEVCKKFLNSEIDVRREALWAIANAISKGTKQQVEKIVKEFNLLEGIVQMLQIKDARAISVCLETIQCEILDIFKYDMDTLIGIDEVIVHVESLLAHCDNSIFELAQQTIKTFENYDETIRQSDCSTPFNPGNSSGFSVK